MIVNFIQAQDTSMSFGPLKALYLYKLKPKNSHTYSTPYRLTVCAKCITK